MTGYQIIVAEDHSDFRRLVCQELESASDLHVVGEVNDGQELLALLEQVCPDLIILDISMPNFGGMEAAKRIKQSHPHVKILFLTMHKNPVYIEQAQKMGVEGYLLKEEMGQALLQAILKIRSGHSYFSPVLTQYPNGRYCC